MLFPGWIYIAQSPWHFGDFCNIFLPNIGEDQKSLTILARGQPGTVPYGKSGSGYCNMFIKKLDEGKGAETRRGDISP